MIDQLRRKKFLENLSGRSPAQVPSVADEIVATDRMDIEGEYKDDPSLLSEADASLSDTVKIDRAREKSDNISGDLMVGASHTLLGLLSGNHNRAAMEYGKGNKYVQDRAKEDIITSKDLVKTNQDGKAIYTPAKEAVDMEAYIPTKGANGGSSGRDNDVFNIYEPDTGKSYGVQFNKREGKYKTNSGVEVIIPDNAIIRPFSNKLVKTTDMEGTTTVDAYNQHAKAPVAPIKQVEGEGAAVNMPLAKVRDAEDVASKYEAKASKYQEDLADMASSKSILADKNSAPQAQKQAIGRIIKQIESRMTDADRAEYKSESSALVNIGNQVDMLTSNEIPPQLVRAFLKASKDMESKVKYTAEQYREGVTRGFAGPNRKYRKYIQDRLKPISGDLPYTASQPEKNFKQENTAQAPISKSNPAYLEMLMQEKAKRAKAAK
jgi:hypothetical protein